MFIPTWLLVVVGLAFLYFRLRSQSSTVLESAKSAQTLWELGNKHRDDVLEYSHLIDDYLHDERQVIRAMETDALRLRELFKHDEQRQMQIARDWFDYASSKARIKDAREMLDVSMEPDAHQTYMEATREDVITIQEIGKRFLEALGDESYLKLALEECEREDGLDFEERQRLIAARRRPKPQRGLHG